MPKISKSNLLYLFFHPLTLALYAFALVLYATPNYFQKYNAEVVNSKSLNSHDQVYYHDLNGDGISERVLSLVNAGAETPAISYFYGDDKIINQWNLRGNWLIWQKLFFGDYDNNGYAEVYCITRVKDSLFLNAKELLLKNGLEITDKFICKSEFFKDDKIDIFTVDARVMDVNLDDYGDFVFTFFSGFSHQPRNTFTYNIVDDSFIVSPTSASGFLGEVNYMDINNDGIDEITGQVSAVDNIHYKLPYPDSCSWLMVINPSNNMDFLFPPIKFEGKFGGVVPSFIHIEGVNYIVTIHNILTESYSTNGFVFNLYNSKGKLLKEKLIPYNDYGKFQVINSFYEDDKNFYLIDSKGRIYSSDTSFNIKPLSNPDYSDLHIYTNNMRILDADGDGENEILFYALASTHDKLVIYRSSLRESTVIDLPESNLVMESHITLNHREKGLPPIIVLQAKNVVYYISYRKSKYYFLKYPAYIIVYFLLFLMFWGLQKVQNKLARSKFETEMNLVRQQLTISKNQLEPHFMLNTLNNIGYMFSKENKDDAQYYFGRFASLIHRGLKYADQVETSLSEELEFVRDYLILQKQRFEGDLENIIEAEDNIDQKAIKLPHSLIFTFVENAVKHGLRDKPNNRLLSIYISKSKSKIEIVITDNGIGRKQSKVMKTAGTGKGLGIVANIVEGYNKLYSRSISYEVKDLVDGSGEGVGTEVKILV